MLRALLIDDEPDARADLRALLDAHASNVRIVGEAESLDEAEQLLATAAYDLVFLDIQLRGGTGFDLVPRIRPEARIVFVTAHDRHALRAFEVNALNYLLKPISPERLAASLERVVHALALSSATTLFSEPRPDDAPAPPLRPADIIQLRNGTCARFVPLREISAIEAEQNYSAACLADGTRLLLRRTLKSWEDILPVTHFMRVHRTAIVNLERITRYERDREEHTLLFLEGVPAPVSATRKLWPDLQSRLTHLRPPV